MAADTSKKSFDVPAGDASETLKRFAQQAAQQVVYPANDVRGVHTAAVKGSLTVREGLDRLLAGTELTAAFDEKNATFAVSRAAGPNGPRTAQTVKSDRPGRSENAGNEGIVVLDTFKVTGQLLSLRRAIADKRAEVVISDASSSDEMGSIPDFGLGEALERLPGVSMITNNGRGEPQFATIRALNSDYNAVLVDGMVLPPTESGRRTVSLDTIPSSFAKVIRIYKSFTPEMDGNAIGGIVDVRTRSAFDNRGLFVSARAKLGYNENELSLANSAPPSEGELTVSNTFGAKQQYGLVVSASSYHRPLSELFTSIESVTFYNASGVAVAQNLPEVATATPVPAARRWYAYDNIRDRQSLSGKLEYQGEHGLKIHLTGGGFRFNTYTRRPSNRLLSSGVPTITSPTTGTFAKATGLVANDLFDQTRTIAYGTLGATFDPSPGSQLEFSAHYASGYYISKDEINTYQTTTTTSLAYGYEFERNSTPYVKPLNESFYYDPANYRETQRLFQKTETANTILAFSAAYGRNARPGDEGFGFKAGTQYRRSYVENNLSQSDYRPTSTTLTLAGALDPRSIIPYNGRGTRLLIVDTAAARAVFEANRNLYPLASNNATANITGDDSLTEEVKAAYAMGLYQKGRFAGTAGVRLEATSLATTSITTRTAGGVTTLLPETRSGNYDKLLPSANASYNLTNQLLLRAAASRSLSRPNFNALTAKSIETQTADGIFIDEGNPDLKARESNNYDLSVEWYFSKKALLAAAYFHKDLQNEILRTTTPTIDTIGGVATAVTTRTWRNIERASIDGLELSYTDTKLDFLPRVLDGLGVQMNLTLLSMQTPSVTMNDKTLRKLPSLLESPKMTFNASLLYQVGKLGARVSYKHTGPIMYLLDTSSASLDRYTRSSDRYDAQLRYQFNRSWGLTLDGKNLTNARVNRFFGPTADVRREEGDSGRSWFVGVNYVFK
jgi:TonB-dependent receptor